MWVKIPKALVPVRSVQQLLFNSKRGLESAFTESVWREFILIIPQPPLPFKNNGLSHDQHSVKQQGGSGVCEETVVDRELLALAIFSLLPYLRYVILLQLKHCKTKFIVKLLDREIHSYSAIGLLDDTVTLLK